MNFQQNKMNILENFVFQGEVRLEKWALEVSVSERSRCTVRERKAENVKTIVVQVNRFTTRCRKWKVKWCR